MDLYISATTQTTQPKSPKMYVWHVGMTLNPHTANTLCCDFIWTRDRIYPVVTTPKEYTPCSYL